jgi:hypothetical protein
MRSKETNLASQIRAPALTTVKAGTLIHEAKTNPPTVIPALSTGGANWLQNSSSQLMVSPTHQGPFSQSGQDSHYPPFSAADDNAASHSPSLASASSGPQTATRRLSAVEALQTLVDSSTFLDAHADGIPLTVPYEYQTMLIDNCLKAFQMEQKERLFRSDAAKTLVQRKPYRKCGVPMIEESPKVSNYHEV